MLRITAWPQFCFSVTILPRHYCETLLKCSNIKERPILWQIQYVANVGRGWQRQKQWNFHSLPKRYKQIRRFEQRPFVNFIAWSCSFHNRLCYAELLFNEETVKICVMTHKIFIYILPLCCFQLLFLSSGTRVQTFIVSLVFVLKTANCFLCKVFITHRNSTRFSTCH